MPSPDDAEDRWAEARSLLDRAPTESAERRMLRSRRTRILTVLAVALLAGAPVGIGAVWLADSSGLATSPADVPQGQEVAGLAIAGAGLLMLVVAVVAQIRSNRRTSAWRSPLVVLTGDQKKELLAIVRRRGDVPPDRLLLARHLASNMLDQRHVVLLLLGQAVMWTGFLIATPAWWRAILAVVLLGAAVVGVLLVRRQERQARRFLAEHEPR
jgi:Ca2+/Na+ antiporter